MELEVSPHLERTWSSVSTFDGLSMSHTMTATEVTIDVVTGLEEALEPGDIVAYEHYRFRIRAVNAYGYSDYSEELVASIAPLPSKLDPVEKDQAYSSSTSIMVRWATPSDQEPIIGYRL